MRSWRWIIRLLAGCIAAGGMGLPSSALYGGDRCQAFVDGLRDPKRGFYDLALDYLETMRTSPMADKAFQEVIDYEVGVTLLQAARLLPPKQREKQLDEAAGYFKKFLADHFQHTLATSAKRQLATIQIEQAQIKTSNARQSGIAPSEKQRLLDEARSLLQEAEQALSAIDVVISKMVKGLRNVDEKDVKAVEARDRVWSEAILTRLALTGILVERAQTYEPGSKERRELLTTAAAQFNDRYRIYNKWLGGYEFRIQEARCHMELGHYPAALYVLDELASPQPNDDEKARWFRTKATLMALEIDLLPQVKKYRDAWSTYENWATNTERPGEADNQRPAIKCLGGEAALEFAREMDPNDAGEGPMRKEYLQLAKELLTFAARSPGEYRLKAQVKLTDPLLVVGEVFGGAPKSYAEARDLARIAWGQLQQPSLKPEQFDRLRTQALLYFRFALAHAPRDVAIGEINGIRFCLEYLDWVSGDCYDAVVLGEFLARRYTDGPEAQRAARVALLAYLRLSGAVAAGGDRRFETERLTALAHFITERWPQGAAADDAWTVLACSAAGSQDVEKTLEYLGHISTDSPRRSETELATGQALWQACLEAARLPEEQQPTKTKMTRMAAQSQKLLEDGAGRLRKAVEAGGEVSYPLAGASLSLAQICLETGEGAKAVAWLDDPKLGAHTLVNAGSRATGRIAFRVEILKTALRAYVATQQLEKADAAIGALEQTAGDSAHLAQIYLSLGRQIEDSLKRIRAEGNQAEAVKVARGFEFFLMRISSRPAEETTFTLLDWVAETFVSLAVGMDSGDNRPPAEAEDYYKKAAQVYRKILEACRADAKFAPQPSAAPNIRIRLARCLRRLGRFEEALGVLVDILKVREGAIDAQCEAAQTYQAWGEETPAYFLRAIHGGWPIERKNGERANLVWGMGDVARRVQFSKPFQNVFDEARYNLALCRLKYALGKSDQEKTDQLQQAEQDILVVQRLRPEMGGKKWYNQYDALLRRIQRFLGVKEEQQGLKAAETKLSAAVK